MNLYREHSYCELVTGGYKANKRNNVLAAAEFNKQLSQNGKQGCYRSHFRFTKDYQDYVRRTGSVKGYSGPAYVDFLWLDIDNSQDPDISVNLQRSLEVARIYIERLKEYEIAPSDLRCYFSGKKGFHIGIPAEAFGLKPSKDLPATCKHLAEALAGDLDYDPSIYDRTRIFRLNNTQHEDSGLYKIELDPTEISVGSVQEILELAKAPRALDREYHPEDIYGTLAYMLPRIDTKTQEGQPQKKENWITDLLDNGASEGGRTRAVLRLARYYSSQGIPEDITLSLITTWDTATNTQPLTGDPGYPPDKIASTVADAYKYAAEASASQDKPNENQPGKEVIFHTWESLHHQAPAYVETFYKNRIKFGFPAIDSQSACLGRGEVANLLAYVGVGKSALAQNIALTARTEQNISSVIFSMEMNAMMLYFRQIAMLWNMTISEVAESYSVGNGDDLIKGLEQYSGMHVVDFIPLSIPLMTDCLKKFDQEVGLVIVDYVGLLDHPSDKEYERMSNLSRGLALMAKELNVAVLAIYQTNRTDADGEVFLRSGRGSGLIEANCDITLGLWAEEKYPSERIVKLLKARHGIAGAKQRLAFTGKSPRLYVIDRGDDDYESSS